MRALSLLLCLCFLFSFASAQDKQDVIVKYLAPPIYPAIASTVGLQGKVKVEVETSPDGKVTTAMASGANEILRHAAEENIHEWTFDSSRKALKFTVTYVYKLEGKPTHHAGEIRIILELPSRVEIIGRPTIPNP